MQTKLSISPSHSILTPGTARRKVVSTIPKTGYHKRKFAAQITNDTKVVCWLLYSPATCSHVDTEVADQTFYLTRYQYTDTVPTSLIANSITPGARQVSHWTNEAACRYRRVDIMPLNRNVIIIIIISTTTTTTVTVTVTVTVTITITITITIMIIIIINIIMMMMMMMMI